MKPSRLSHLAAIAALAALAGGCAPAHLRQGPDPAYAAPGTYASSPQSAAGSYGPYDGSGAYGSPVADAAYGNGYATGGAGYVQPAQVGGDRTQGAYGAYGNGDATAAAGSPPPNGYGQPYGAPNPNGYYARGTGQYPPPSTFDVSQPYYGDGGYHLMGTYNDGESHPLRLVSFAVAPIGYLAEWLVTRPIHRVVAQQDMAPIFSYTPQAGFDYETYEEGLSTGVTFEEPQSLD